MIIIIQPGNVDRWLSPKKCAESELQAILSDRQTPFYANDKMAV
jgi:hypothetical protein